MQTSIRFQRSAGRVVATDSGELTGFGISLNIFSKRVSGPGGLYETGADRAELPRVQHVPHLILPHPVMRGNWRAAPSQHKVELDDPPLQFGRATMGKRGDLGGEADPVGANGFPQVADIDLLDILIANALREVRRQIPGEELLRRQVWRFCSTRA